MRKDKLLAVNLRKQGYSYNQIRQVLTIPKSTLSYWLKDIKLSKKAQDRINKRLKKGSLALIKRNKRQTDLAKERYFKIKEIAKLEVKKLSKNNLFISGISLYWAEGYKKGDQGSKWKVVDFTNSDPAMILVMLNFFKQICKADEKKIKIQLIAHQNINIEKAMNYWAKLTKTPETQFIKYSKPNIKSTGKRKNTLPYGTVHIRLYDVEIFYKIIGWIEGIKELLK